MKTDTATRNEKMDDETTQDVFKRMTHCFVGRRYDGNLKGSLVAIDGMHPDTGKSLINADTLEDIQARDKYTEVQIMKWETYYDQEQEEAKQDVTATTEGRFNEMLECLPPLGWRNGSGAESFKVSEMWTGDITDIFCMIGDNFYHLRDKKQLTHDEITKRCCFMRDKQERCKAAIVKKYGEDESIAFTLCDFVATGDNGNQRRVFGYDVCGSEEKGHIVFSFYYETHLAMMISFKTKADGYAYVNSQGKSDNRMTFGN